jgi:hypothetical protein
MKAAELLPLPDDPDAVEARQGESYSIIYSDGRLERLGTWRHRDVPPESELSRPDRSASLSNPGATKPG